MAKAPLEIINGQKFCTGCETMVNVVGFSKDKSQHSGLRSKCKNCCKIDADANAPYRARYYKANRDKIIASQAKHKTKRAKIHLIKYATIEYRARSLFLSARKRASLSGREFTITTNDVIEMLRVGVCAATGLTLHMKSNAGKRNPFAPSLDRRDSTLGYTIDNVQIVCDMYNLGKNQYPELDFVAMCFAIAHRNTNNTAALMRLAELHNATV